MASGVQRHGGADQGETLRQHFEIPVQALLLSGSEILDARLSSDNRPAGCRVRRSAEHRPARGRRRERRAPPAPSLLPKYHLAGGVLQLDGHAVRHLAVGIDADALDVEADEQDVAGSQRFVARSGPSRPCVERTCVSDKPAWAGAAQGRISKARWSTSEENLSLKIGRRSAEESIRRIEQCLRPDSTIRGESASRTQQLPCSVPARSLIFNPHGVRGVCFWK